MSEPLYRACMYCTADLGRNRIVEHQPIGARLAFDEVTGRLWVVCPSCARWNLVPFDHRYEAIAACERLYRATSDRFSTGEIGLARTREGLHLIRLGQAPVHEEITWRYGDEFQRRSRRRLTTALGGAAGGAAIIGALGLLTPLPLAASMLIGTAVAGYAGAAGGAVLALRRVLGRLPLHERTGGVFTWKDLNAARVRIEPDGTWGLRAQARPRLHGRRIGLGDMAPRPFLAEGARATDVLAHLVPAYNRAGASATGHLMREARRILGRGDVLGQMATMSRQSMPAGVVIGGQLHPLDQDTLPNYFLGSFPAAYLLALEITLHGAREREALAGELAWLQRQWREADALAAIADGLAIPDELAEQIAAWQGPER